MKLNKTFMRLYALQSKETGILWGHAMPMQAAVKAQINAKRLGYNCGIVRVQ